MWIGQFLLRFHRFLHILGDSTSRPSVRTMILSSVTWYQQHHSHNSIWSVLPVSWLTSSSAAHHLLSYSFAYFSISQILHFLFSKWLGQVLASTISSSAALLLFPTSPVSRSNDDATAHFLRSGSFQGYSRLHRRMHRLGGILELGYHLFVSYSSFWRK